MKQTVAELASLPQNSTISAPDCIEPRDSRWLLAFGCIGLMQPCPSAMDRNRRVLPQGGEKAQEKGAEIFNGSGMACACNASSMHRRH